MRQVVAIVLFLTLLSACASNLPEVSSPTPTASPAPTQTPVRELIGTEANPLVIGYVIEDDPDSMEVTLQDLDRELSADSGLVVKSQVFADHQKLYASLKIGGVHAAWMQPMTYITAHRDNLANVLMLSNHFGVYFYGTQFLANVESGYRSYYDPVSNKNSGTAATALAQLRMARPCYMEPGSLSGNIVPQGIFNSNDIPTNYPSIIQSFTGIVRALYIKGICDFGAVYSENGDPRTGSAVLGDLTDATQRVVVLWKSDPVIPNLAFAVTPSLEPTSVEQLAKAFSELIVTDSGKAMLSAVNGGYEIQDLRRVDDSVYDPLRVYLSHTSVRTEEWLGR